MPLQLQNDDDTFTITDDTLLDGGAPDVTYTCRRLTTQKHREFIRLNTSGTRRTGEDKINGHKLSDDLVDYVLVNWSGILDKGQPVPCERALKLKLDSARKGALIVQAGLSEVMAAEAARGESFRQS